MAKRKKSMPGRQSAISESWTGSNAISNNRNTKSNEKPATLKDLLPADVLKKLQSQADQLKAEEARQQEEKRRQLEEERKAEQKRLDQDFEYLFKNSKMDWSKYK